MKTVRFSRNLTVDVIDANDESDYRNFVEGDTFAVSYVNELSDSFLNITLNGGVLLLDVPRNAVKIVE